MAPAVYLCTMKHLVHVYDMRFSRYALLSSPGLCKNIHSCLGGGRCVILYNRHLNGAQQPRCIGPHKEQSLSLDRIIITLS